MDRSELRRLQKAVKDNNKMALYEWGSQFENQIKNELRNEFEKYYHCVLLDSIDNLLIALCFTAIFSEAVPALNADNFEEFMDDLFVTINMFNTGEYNPMDYYKQLKENGIDIDGILKNKKEFMEVKKECEAIINYGRKEEENANNKN